MQFSQKNLKKFLILFTFIFFTFSYLYSKSLASPPQQRAGEPSERPKLDYVPGEIIVKLKDPSNEREIFQEDQSSHTLGKLSSSGQISLKKSTDGLFLYKVSSPNSLGSSPNIASKVGGSLQETINSLKKDPRIEYVEPNYYLYPPPLEATRTHQSERARHLNLQSQTGIIHHAINSQTNSNDNPLSQSTSNDESTLTPKTTNLDQDNAPDEETPTDEEPIIVAVIDSGINTNHYYFLLTNSLWENPEEAEENSDNNLDDDNNNYTDDVHGWNFLDNSNSVEDDDSHGTHVSGIVVRSFYKLINPFLVPSVNEKLKIMPLKISDLENPGTTLRAAQAIKYAIRQGAKVINASWATNHYSQTLHRAIFEAYEQGVLFVTSSGNENRNNDEKPTYPGNLDVPNVISVAASNTSIEEFNQSNPSENIRARKDQLAGFSNFGVQTVHIAAPGVEIISPVPPSGPLDPGLATFGIASGTSQATPVVAGLAAKIIEQHSDLSAYALRETLFAASTQRPSLAELLITGSHVNFESTYNLSSELVNNQNNIDYIFRPPENKENKRDLASREEPQDQNEEERVKEVLKEVAGCGIISRFYSKPGGGGKGGLKPSTKNRLSIFLVITLISLPFLVNFIMYRKEKNQRKRRKHTRFKIRSNVSIEMGDKKFSGQLQTLSVGGAQMNTDAILEQGGIVNMNIRSPDGKESLNIEGHIVWREVKKKYGIQFLNVTSDSSSCISNWTKNLKKI